MKQLKTNQLTLVTSSDKKETYNLLAAHGYFGRSILQYASFNNSRSLHFFNPVCTVAQAAATLEASAAEQAMKPAQQPEQASGPTPFVAAHLKDANLEQPAAAKEEASEAAAEADEWFYKDPADNIQVRAIWICGQACIISIKVPGRAKL